MSGTIMTGGQRIATLDIIRGVAVMGIFGVNVISFAMPEQAYFNPSVYGLRSPADLGLWFATFILIDGKMRGLFSLLFGASMLLVIERAEAAGRPPADIHYSRMFWLLVLGCVHYYLIWYGDILTLYALTGMIAYLFRRKPVRTLVIWGLAFLGLDLIVMSGLAAQFFLLEAAARSPGASPDTIAQWQMMSSAFAPPDRAALAHDFALYQGPWLGIVREQFGQGLAGPVFQFAVGVLETLGYMLLGMAGLKSGFLKGAWDDARYRRIACWTLAISIPVYAAFGWIEWRSGFDTSIFFLIFFVLTNPFRLAMMAGYAALIILLTRRRGAFVARIAAAGRAAFTNYLGASLIACLIFYGYGFGLYGRLSRLEAWLFAPALWVVMLLWSTPWLDRFHYGPFEWLWRSLARRRPQPILRQPAPA